MNVSSDGTNKPLFTNLLEDCFNLNKNSFNNKKYQRNLKLLTNNNYKKYESLLHEKIKFPNFYRNKVSQFNCNVIYSLTSYFNHINITTNPSNINLNLFLHSIPKENNLNMNLYLNNNNFRYKFIFPTQPSIFKIKSCSNIIRNSIELKKNLVFNTLSGLNFSIFNLSLIPLFKLNLFKSETTTRLKYRSRYTYYSFYLLTEITSAIFRDRRNIISVKFLRLFRSGSFYSFFTNKNSFLNANNNFRNYKINNFIQLNKYTPINLFTKLYNLDRKDIH